MQRNGFLLFYFAKSRLLPSDSEPQTQSTPSHPAQPARMHPQYLLSKRRPQTFYLSFFSSLPLHRIRRVALRRICDPMFSNRGSFDPPITQPKKYSIPKHYSTARDMSRGSDGPAIKCFQTRLEASIKCGRIIRNKIFLLWFVKCDCFVDCRPISIMRSAPNSLFFG